MDAPVIDNLHDITKCGIFTNPSGEVLIVHEDPIEGVLTWVEYAPDNKQLSLVYEDGRYQLLGIPIPDDMAEHLLNSAEVILCCVANGKISQHQRASLVIQKY